MTTPDAPLVLRHDDDRGVCTLTLNRPTAFNALSEEMLTALQSELDNLSKSQKLRVLVIAASGKAFCAGHDLRQMRAEPSMDYYQKLFSQCGQMMMSIQKLQVPVIAKVQGIVWRVERVKFIQVPQQYNLRMLFNDNAKLYGFSGCNVFNASYSQSSNLLKVNPLVSTKKYCAQSNYYESNFTQHLQMADRIELNGDKLQLFHNNEVVVEMKPALN